MFLQSLVLMNSSFCVPATKAYFPGGQCLFSGRGPTPFDGLCVMTMQGHHNLSICGSPLPF